MFTYHIRYSVRRFANSEITEGRANFPTLDELMNEADTIAVNSAEVVAIDFFKTTKENGKVKVISHWR